MIKQHPGPSPQAQSQLPEFASYEEEAEFWDTHDVTDFIDESAPKPAAFGEVRSLGIMLPMDIFEMGVWREIGDCAKQAGVDATTLLQRWILERLADERERSANAGNTGV